MSNWKTYKLSEILNLVGGGTPKTTVSEYWNGNIPWLSVVDFGNCNKYVYQTEKTITEKGLNESSTKILKTGQIIISARGTVGALAMLGKDMAFNQSCYGIYSNEKTTNDFLYYLLKDSISRIKKNTHGAVFDTITKQTFENIEVSVPEEKTEQTQIAQILSSLDDKIELLQQMNQTLENIAQAIFKEWFVDFNFPGFDGELVDGLPKGWKINELRELISVKDGTHDSPKQQLSGKYLITSKHLKNHYIDFETAYKISEEDYEKINKRSKVDTLDVLITMIGTVGNLYFVHNPEIDFAIKNIGLFKTSEKPELAYFLYFSISSKEITDYYKKRLAGSTQQYLTLEALRQTPILMPDEGTLSKFNRTAKNLYSKIQENIIQIKTLTQTRDTLLPKLMSGQLEIKNCSNLKP